MIIKSILDSDLYKFTQQKFVLQHYPNVDADYIFNNRDKSMKFNQEALTEIKKEVELMSNLYLTSQEYDWIKKEIYFFDPMYRQYLSSYRFNPNQVKINLDNDGNLDIKISGKWREVILWEVPLMAIISEVYFKIMDTDWDNNIKKQELLAENKAYQLFINDCKFTDFGTRRRRNYETQNLVVSTMKKCKGFVGTSNPHLAMINSVKAIGTISHETIMAVSALESMNHPDRHTMEKWLQTYGAAMGTYLTDCYTTDSFLKDFDLLFAKTFDGVRNDSGDPFEFTDKIINHYKKLNIDPTTKTIIFSDSLDVEKAIKLNEYCKGKIRCSFGIGTFFSNDFKKNDGTRSKPLNMVIKLDEVDGKKVCKLSDTPTKAIGDPSVVKIMKYIHLGEKIN
jgi:nicotinate phosphoribosyltransferase